MKMQDTTREGAFLFAKYVVVGGLNTVFGYGIFALLIYSGLHYPIALLISTILGVAFNFKSTGVLVFESHDNRLIFRFLAIYCVTYLLNLFGLKMLATGGLSMYYAAAVMLPIMAVIGFVANRKLVFKK